MTLTDLRRLAEAATPGPWHPESRLVVNNDEDVIAMCNLAMGKDDSYALARHFAALSPERVLALLDVIDAAKAMRDDFCGIRELDDEIDRFDASLAKLEGMK